MKFYTLIIAFFGYAFPAWASDEDEIMTIMENYWAAYTQTDFTSAADFICPADLSLAKSELLPIFLKAGVSADPELNSIADMFFLNIPQESRANITGKQVFVALNNFIMAANPSLINTIRDTSIESISIDIIENETASLTYRIQIQDFPITDIERFSKPKDKWCLRVRENPRETAKKFQRVLGL